jgi:hypothetical protein
MKRLDAAIIAAGLLLVVIGLWVAETAEGRFTAGMATLAAVLAGLALNHTIARPPRLVVRYVNRDTDTPVVWNDPKMWAVLVVFGEPWAGSGTGRRGGIRPPEHGAVEPLGNALYPEEVNIWVNPPRFTGGERVLNPGDSPWRIAALWPTKRSWEAGLKARWRARADGMDEQTGEVEIIVLDGPPS